MKELWRSLVSVVRFWKVTSRWRWWDYGFSLDLLVRDLTLKEREWGKSTHYVGDQFTKKRLQVLLRMYERYLEAGPFDEAMLLRKFLRTYARNLPRFWD